MREELCRFYDFHDLTLPEWGPYSKQFFGISHLSDRETGMATWPVLTPRTPLEKLMRDADVGQLGTPNFLEAALLLRRELELGGQVFTDHEFWCFERNFLGRICFFSEAAQTLRGPGLELSRALVAGKLACLEEESRA